MVEVPKENPWEQAYLAQCHDAVVGRMFKGLIHNMNGVMQAISMQSELFGMMFDQAEGMLEEILACLPEGDAREQAEKLKDLLCRRADGVTMLEDKILQGQVIMGRTLELAELSAAAGVGLYTMNSVIRTEMEFLSADRFFKHNLHKKLDLADDLPPFSRRQLELHQVVFALLSNSLDALRDQDGAEITIKTFWDNETVKVSVANNGPEILPEDMGRLFEPFFTTRENHAGLGLYLAQKLVTGFGGELRCEASAPGGTSFLLVVPVAEVVSVD